MKEAEMKEIAKAIAVVLSGPQDPAKIADAQGIDIDNVFDVARVMRLPGTTNRKEGGARPVTVTDADWDRRYGLDDLDQHLDAPPAPPAHRTGTTVPYIGPERPGTAYNVRHTGGDVLRSHGFTLARTDRNDPFLTERFELFVGARELAISHSALDGCRLLRALLEAPLLERRRADGMRFLCELHCRLHKAERAGCPVRVARLELNGRNAALFCFASGW
jgi:hypothetical protein